MPDAVGVTYVYRPNFPNQLMLQIPDSVIVDKKTGDPIPGRKQTFTFEKRRGGTFYANVPASLADAVLNGAVGMLPYAKVEGQKLYERAFVLGDHTKKNTAESTAQHVNALESQLKSLTPLLEALVKSGVIDQETLKAAGLAADAEDEADDDEPEPVVPVSDASKFTVNTGDVMQNEQGALLCPICEEYATMPIGPDYPEKKARQTINGHMIHCRKKHETESDEG